MKLALLISVLAFVFSCSHKMDIRSENVSAVKEGGIKVQGLWLKDKHDKFHMGVSLTNLAKQSIIIPRSEFDCMRGTQKGYVKKTSLDGAYAGNWVLSSGENKEFYIVCELGQDVKVGEFAFVIKKVYEDSKGDGVTRGKVLVENTTLKIAK